MGWFAEPRAPAPAAGPGRLHSHALKEVLQALRPGSRRTVLDLGPSLAGNVKLLAARAGRVRIADLHRALCVESLESRRPEAMSALIARLLPLAPDERFSAVLAWDVFDYLRPDQVAALMTWLAPACDPEAPVLVLASTRREMPPAPLRYRIVDAETLAGEGPGTPPRPCPRHTQPDLERMMPGFSVRRSVLLRSGTQEYLFARDSGEPVARERSEAAVRGGSSRYRWLREGPL